MVALFHEGKSIDRDFFELLLSHLKLNFNKVSFYGMGSKSNFFKQNNKSYKKLKLEIYDNKVDKILFIIDSDYEKDNKIYGGYENSLREIKLIQKELNIENISDTFIAYDKNSNTKEGYLESLILSSLDNQQRECIESFLNKCPEFKGRDNHKSIFNMIYKNAYPKAPYNFEHRNFDELKKKLKDLFNE